MAGTFKFELVSPERILLSADAMQVVVPGTEGEFTVLEGHAPFITTLKPGVLDITLAEGTRKVFVKSGIADTDAERLTILAQGAVDIEEFSSARISAELAEAQADLDKGDFDDAQRLINETLVAELKRLHSAA